MLQTSFLSQKDGSADGIGWSQFAYVQYVTTVAYLCKSVMLFDRLHKLGGKADRLLLYPRQYSLDEGEGNAAGALLRKARTNTVRYWEQSKLSIERRQTISGKLLKPCTSTIFSKRKIG